jgi:hypothetical protein
MGISTTVTVTWAVALTPAVLVTVRVKVVVSARLPDDNGVPLVTAPRPLFTVPFPLVKTGISVVEVPVAIDGLAAVKDVMLGEVEVGVVGLPPLFPPPVPPPPQEMARPRTPARTNAPIPCKIPTRTFR